MRRRQEIPFRQGLTNLIHPAGSPARVGFIPENPLSMAIAPYMTVLQNMALTRTWKYARNGVCG